VLENSEEMTLVFQPDHVVDKVFKVVRRFLSVCVDLRREIKVFNELKMYQLPARPSHADDPSSVVSDACAHNKMILFWTHGGVRPQQHDIAIDVIIPAVLIVESLEMQCIPDSPELEMT
jgi:hypothetical protein